MVSREEPDLGGQPSVIDAGLTPAVACCNDSGGRAAAISLNSSLLVRVRACVSVCNPSVFHPNFCFWNLKRHLHLCGSDPIQMHCAAEYMVVADLTLMHAGGRRRRNNMVNLSYWLLYHDFPFLSRSGPCQGITLFLSFLQPSSYFVSVFHSLPFLSFVPPPSTFYIPLFSLSVVSPLFFSFLSIISSSCVLFFF